MASKDQAKPPAQFKEIVVRLQDLEDGPGVRRAIWNELQSNPKPYSWVAGILIPLLSAVFWYAVLSPIKETRSDLHDLTKPDGLIDRQTKMLSDQNGKIEGLSNKLSTLEPFIRSLALKKLDDATVLTPSELKASLPQLASTSAAGKAIGLSIDTSTLDKLRLNLSRLDAQSNPAYWTFGGNLLGMRSTPSPKPTLCVAEVNGANVKLDVIDHISLVSFHDCTVDIGDISAFVGGSGYYHQQVVNGNKTPQIALNLTNVRVVYTGGPVIPVTSITFADCVFSFELNEAPQNTLGKEITKRLLASADLKKVSVDAIENSQGM